MSVGHDEYWSANQRANVEAARDAGVNLAFFSGNEVFWKTRWEPSIDGTVDAVPHARVVQGDPRRSEDRSRSRSGPGRGATRSVPPSDAGRPENALDRHASSRSTAARTAINVPRERSSSCDSGATRGLSTLEGVDADARRTDRSGYEWNEDLDNGSRPPGQIDLSSTTVVGTQVLQD